MDRGSKLKSRPKLKTMKRSQFCYSAPTEERSTVMSMSARVCVCVCVCVCLSAIVSLELDMSDLHQRFVHVTYGRGSVLLCRRSNHHHHQFNTHECSMNNKR